MTTLQINDKGYRRDGDPTMPLLWLLHDVAGLTGTKFGCRQGLCEIYSPISQAAGGGK